MPTSQDRLPVTMASTSQYLPPLMRRFQLWTVVLFAVSFCFHLFMRLVFHHHDHLGFPLSLNQHDRFNDFTIFADKFKFFGTREFFQVGFPINYPAPVCVVFEIFFKLPHSLAFFIAFSVLSFLIPAALFARALMRRGISSSPAWTFCAILCFLSWPVALVVDGANAEVIVWLATLIAMWAYATGRGWLAAAFFGIAASLKLFPFVFLALFLNRRDVKKLFFGIATFLAVSVASLAILGPTISAAYRGISFGVASFKENYMARWRPGENGVDHSLFALIKATLIVVARHGSDFSSWLHPYLLASAVGGLALYFLRIRFMPLLNQVIVLTITCIYFTPFSGDGTLIHLYGPLGMIFFLIIQASRDGVVIPGLATITYCMVFCLSFESILVLHFNHIQRFMPIQRFIGPAHAIALGIMLIAALRYPLGPPLAQRDDSSILSKPVLGWLLRSDSSPDPFQINHAR